MKDGSQDNAAQQGSAHSQYHTLASAGRRYAKRLAIDTENYPDFINTLSPIPHLASMVDKTDMYEWSSLLISQRPDVLSQPCPLLTLVLR